MTGGTRAALVAAAVFGTYGPDTALPVGQYDVIAERNVFGLRKGEPASAASSAPEVFKPPPELKLTGIVSMGPHPWACLMVAPPGKPPHYFNLMAGQSDAGVEVLGIDVAADKVIVRVEGRETTLGFGKPDAKPTPAQLAERRFASEHARAHEERERREQQRRERERVAVAQGWDPATGQRIPTPEPTPGEAGEGQVGQASFE